MKRATLSCAVAVLIAAAAAAALRAQGAAPAPTLPAEFNTQTGQRIRVTMVAGGLVHPWSIVFPDARTILVAERSGKIRVIKDGMLQAQPVWEAPPHPASDNGLPQAWGRRQTKSGVRRGPATCGSGRRS